MFCPKCGEELTGNARYCSRCGAAVENAPEGEIRVNNIKSKVLLFVFSAIVLLLVICFAIMFEKGDFRHLGAHDWKEATCTDAEVCTRCGMTRGEAQGHKWTESNGNSQICEECDFVKKDRNTETDESESVSAETVTEEAVLEEAETEVDVWNENEKGKLVLSEKDKGIFCGLAQYYVGREDCYTSIEQMCSKAQGDTYNEGWLFYLIYSYGGTDAYEKYHYFSSETCDKYVLYGAFEEARKIFKELLGIELQSEVFVQDVKDESTDSGISYSQEFEELIVRNGADGGVEWTEYLDCKYNEEEDLYGVSICYYLNNDLIKQVYFFLREKDNSYGYEIIGMECKSLNMDLLSFLGQEYGENGLCLVHSVYKPAYREDGSEIYYEELVAYAGEHYETLGEEWLDVDNDGEEELYLGMNSPLLCGGMIFDARDGEAYLLAEGEGTAVYMSCVFYQDKWWIVHSDTTHIGREIYHLDRYSGAEIVETIDLSAEFWESENSRYDENSDFSYNGEKISMDEYERLKMEIFGY